MSSNNNACQAVFWSTPVSRYFQSEPLVRMAVSAGGLVATIITLLAVLFEPELSTATALMVWAPAVRSLSSKTYGAAASVIRRTPLS